MINIDRICLLNTTKEAGLYLSKNGGVKKPSDLLLAMRPVVANYLRSRGIEARDALAYFTVESHMTALKRSEEIASWLRESAKFAGLSIDASEALESSFMYWSRFAIHTCMWYAEIASNAIKAHSPESVCVCSAGYEAPSLYIEPGERHFATIIKRAAEASGIGFADLAGDTGGVKALVFRWRIWCRQVTRYILENARFMLWSRASLKKYGKGRGGKTLLFTTSSYQMDKLGAKLESSLSDTMVLILSYPVDSFFYVPFPVAYIVAGRGAAYAKEQRNHFSELASKIRQQGGIFSYRGVGFADVILQKYSDTIFNYVEGLVIWSYNLSRLILDLSPSAVVSNGNRDDDLVIAKTCAHAGIKSVLISHGSHVKPGNEFEKIEWSELGRKLLSAPFSVVALQSPLAEGYLDVFPTKSRIAKTGPLIWGKTVDFKAGRECFGEIFGGRHEYGRTRVIVHAGTPKPSKSLRLFVYETPEEYINAIKELAEAVEKTDNAALIVKFRPTSEISVEDLKAAVPFSEKVVLSVGEPMLKVLAIADILVSFSSTVIEESLQNRIPVLLYGGGGRYSHVPSSEIKEGEPVGRSAAYHAAGPGDLFYALQAILRLRIDGRGNDRGLFDKYIYPENERTSLEKIIADE